MTIMFLVLGLILGAIAIVGNAHKSNTLEMSCGLASMLVLSGAVIAAISATEYETAVKIHTDVLSVHISEVVTNANGDTTSIKYELGYQNK
jgi:hypothetical protein